MTNLPHGYKSLFGGSPSQRNGDGVAAEMDSPGFLLLPPLPMACGIDGAVSPEGGAGRGCVGAAGGAAEGNEEVCGGVVVHRQAGGGAAVSSQGGGAKGEEVATDDVDAIPWKRDSFRSSPSPGQGVQIVPRCFFGSLGFIFRVFMHQNSFQVS